MRKVVLFTVVGCFAAWATTQNATLGGIDLSAYPLCGQHCAANASTAMGTCGQFDIGCLCKNLNYFNALSCCISTTCGSADQQASIKFNQNACAQINITIPNFVGCSPFGLTGTNIPTFNTATLTSTSTSGVSTLSTIESAVTSFNATSTITGTFTGGSVLTGSCTSPLFLAFDQGGMVTEYPFIGCTHDRGGCCAGLDPDNQNVLKSCPADYTTTSNACCPSGWSIYPSALGPQTPCYTTANVTLTPPVGGESIVPTQTPMVMNNNLFTYKYDLVPTKSKSTGISEGAAAGIAIGTFLLVLALATFLLFFLRKRRASKTASVRDRGISRPTHLTVDPSLEITTAPPPYVAPIAELASPESDRDPWTLAPTSPLSNTSSGGPERSTPRRPQAPLVPVEMPGSTWMNEHHPAFAFGTGDEEAATLPLPSSRAESEGRPPLSRTGSGRPPLIRADSEKIVVQTGGNGQSITNRKVSDAISPHSAGSGSSPTGAVISPVSPHNERKDGDAELKGAGKIF